MVLFRIFILAALFAPVLPDTLHAQIASDPPRRVASLNLCGDQLLLALADPEQIASLSPLARNSSLSFLHKQAKDYPANGGSAESLIESKADLVLMSSMDARKKQALLNRQGIAVATLSPWTDLSGGREQIQRIATLLGHPERGAALIADIDNALARTKNIAPHPYRVMVLYRRGYVPAENSLVNVLLRHFGLRLHQSVLNMKHGGFIRLESVVTDPPDYVVIDEITGQAIDNGSALLMHPALLRALPEDRRLVSPDNLFLCDGPSTPAAIEQLANEVRTHIE